MLKVFFEFCEFLRFFETVAKHVETMNFRNDCRGLGSWGGRRGQRTGRATVTLCELPRSHCLDLLSDIFKSSPRRGGTIQIFPMDSMYI